MNYSYKKADKKSIHIILTLKNNCNFIIHCLKTRKTFIVLKIYVYFILRTIFKNHQKEILDKNLSIMYLHYNKYINIF
jgi:hypothetical protein